MEEFCSGYATIQHEKTSKNFHLDPTDVDWELSGNERRMGPENLYIGRIVHEELGELRWEVSEYPVGAINHLYHYLNGHTLIKDFDFNVQDRPDDEYFDLDAENHKPSLSVEDLTNWFFQNYEDPANSLPYDSREGGYQWITGGPYHAANVLYDNFPNTDPELIKNASEIIEKNGLYDWTQTNQKLLEEGYFHSSNDHENIEFNGVNDPCKICGTIALTFPKTGDFVHQNCPRCGEFKLSGTAEVMLMMRRNPEFLVKLSGWVYDHGNADDLPMVNSDVLELVEKSKPLTITQRTHRLLLEVRRGQEELGDKFSINAPYLIAATQSRDGAEVQYLYQDLVAQNLVNEISPVSNEQTDNGGGFSKGFNDSFENILRSRPQTSIGSLGVANTNSDSAGRDVVDLLDITVEAGNIARYISLRSLDTPMSIALFGDWGTGKSFLMNKIRAAVDDIADDVSLILEADEECAYCNGVVQIEFNAWHYIESNLWASLTTHIFDRLNDWLDDKVDEKDVVNELFIQLDTAREEVERAENEKHNAIYSQAYLENELIDARAVLKEKQDKLQEYTPADLWQAVQNTITKDTELSKSIKNAGNELGLDTLNKSASDLQAAIQDAKTLSGRGHIAFTALKAKSHLYWLAGLSLVAVPIGVAAALNFIHSDGLSEVVGALVGIIATLTTWLGWGMNFARTALAKLDSFEANLNTIILNETKIFQKKVSAAQAAVDAAHSDVELSEERLSATNQLVDALHLKLFETTPQARLNAFIRHQVANEEYSQHLGLVSTIRRDFEKLSKLMAPSKKDLDDAIKVEEKIGPLFAQNKPFERIILYIDDLDRCPPEKVVEVLQAIHLLLAFPLFVVIVAVDARWVARALRDYYPTLLMENASFELKHTNAVDLESGKLKDNRKPTTDFAASTHDYLEKIFQVPYWVKPVDEASSQEFVDGLLSLKPKSYSRPKSPIVREAILTEQKISEESIQNTPPKKRRREKSKLKTDFEPNPVASEISNYERQYIQVVAPFVGNSPRRLKRFINLYRMIKAGLINEDAEAFVGEEGEALDYKAVLTNLVIVTGAPIYAQEYFRLLLQRYRKRTGIYGENFDELVETVQADEAITSDERIRVMKTLKEYSGSTNETNDHKLEALRKWSRNVARFSFTARPE